MSKFIETLPNAPLVYTLGMFRFPRHPQAAMASLVDAFHGAIRSHGYPHREDTPTQMVSATMGPSGLQIEQQLTSLAQVSSLDRKWAFILTEQVFCIHTIDYVSSADFVERFRVGLSALASIKPNGIEFVEAVSVRYVDLIAPRAGEALSGYFEPWVLPLGAPNLNGQGKLEVTESMYVVACKSDLGEFRFQALRNPPSTLPPDLDTPVIGKNGWKKALPTHGEFVVLDSDHGCRLEAPVPFSADFVSGQMLSLCSTVENWFLAATTERAMNVWKEPKQ